MTNPFPIRTLTGADIPRILEIAHHAGWSQTAGDLDRMLRYSPEGCFGMDIPAQEGWRGGLATMAMGFSHGPELGWIAMVLTDPALRGRGLASHLTEHAIQYLRNLGTHWIKLDASDLGRPIYERIGFVTENLMERGLRAVATPPSPVSTALIEVHSGEPLPLDLDYRGFGADRTRLLEMFLALEGARVASATDARGYAILRPNKWGVQLGPMVCESSEVAESLLRWAIQEADNRPLQWDYIRENSAARSLAAAYGFEVRRVLHRMVLPGILSPPPFQGSADLVYAIAGFDFG